MANKPRKSNLRSIISLVIVISMTALFITSCNNDALFDQNYSFPQQKWEKKDTVAFSVNVQDTLSNYDFILTLRNSTEYLYSNLWVYVAVTAPDGTTSKVAEKLPITHPDGSWIGRVSGSLVENRLRFASKVFPLKGKYTFKIMNATQQGTIPYVEDIGLRIQKNEGK